MELDDVAAALKELGHPTRLGVYKELVRAGEHGASVGDLQKKLNVPSSTLSHHISALVSVGLVRQVREGRILHCIAQYKVLNDLIGFLVDECCAAGRGIPSTFFHMHKG